MEKIRKGDRFICTKNKYDLDGSISFAKGKWYESKTEGRIIDDWGFSLKWETIPKEFTKLNITKQDVKGDIKKLNVDILEAMVTEQVIQGQRPDISKFQRNRRATKAILDGVDGGFSWDLTHEGIYFWGRVIGHGDVDYFYEQRGYPRPAPESRHEVEYITESEIQKIALGVYQEEAKKQKSLKEQLQEIGINPTPVTVELKTPKKPVKKVENQHFLFPQVLKALNARVNVALTGPAGSGKTSMAHNAAGALSLPFYSKSVSAQTGVHEFFGYQDANGNFIRTLFRDAYENGGVFLVDEFDAGNPNVLAALNQATANGSCAFPDKMVDKHKDFIAVMAGNTYGTGATAEYVGRNKIDAATLDRFVFIEVPYDEVWEMAIAQNKDWCKKIQTIRENARKNKVKCIISPRATFNGEKLLAAGMGEEFVLKTVVYKNLSADEIKLINPESLPEGWEQGTYTGTVTGTTPNMREIQILEMLAAGKGSPIPSVWQKFFEDMDKEKG